MGLAVEEVLVEGAAAYGLVEAASREVDPTGEAYHWAHD